MASPSWWRYLLFGLLTWYFEVIPIVFASIGLYLVLNFRVALAAYRRLSITVAAIISMVCLLSGTYWSTAMNTLLGQIANGPGRIHLRRSYSHTLWSNRAW